MDLSKLSTEELMKMRGAPASDLSSIPTEQLMKMRGSDQPDPTGSFGENLKAGIGKAFTDVARGAGQRLREFLTPSAEPLIMASRRRTLAGQIAEPERPKNVADLLGLPTEADAAETAALDKPLMKSGGGMVGNVAGGAAAFAPLAIVPGANTATGAGLVGGLMGLLKPTKEGESPAANAAIGTAIGTATALAGNKAVDLLQRRAATKAAQASTDAAQNATRDAALQAGREAGYVVPPATVKPGLVNEAVESVGGKIATAQTASLKNQKVTDSLAREYLGMGKDSILSKASIADAKNVAAEPYRQIAKISPEAKTALDAWKQANFDSRMQWNYFRKSGNPEAYKAAQAAGDAAEQALNQIETEAAKLVNAHGAQQFVQALQAARVQLGKLSTIESAMTKGGHVDANLIAKMAERMPFKDQLKVIADFAGNFPKAAQIPEKIGGMAHALRPSIGAAAGTLFGGPAGGAAGAAAGVAVPWSVRQALLSGAGQRMMATPSYGTGGAQTIADLLANPATRALLPAGGAAAALNYAGQ